MKAVKLMSRVISLACNTLFTTSKKLYISLPKQKKKKKKTNKTTKKQKQNKTKQKKNKTKQEDLILFTESLESRICCIPFGERRLSPEDPVTHGTRSYKIVQNIFLFTDPLAQDRFLNGV